MLRGRDGYATTDMPLLAGNALPASERNDMATNTGRGSRTGAVRGRTQTYNPSTGSWTKRGPGGRFMDQKADSKPFKGVTKEK